MNRHTNHSRNGPRHQERILVTGGAGYIGALLVPHLLQRGYRVRVVDRLLYGDAGLDAVRAHPDLELVVADFRGQATMLEATDGVDAVIHLGAIVGDTACDLDEKRTLSTNVDATAVLADACRQRGISRFVFVSTCSVYGASDGELDEDSTLNPVSLYARTKIVAEELLLAQAGIAFAPVILRLGTAYGFSPRPRFDLVVNLLTIQALTEGRIAIHGGTQWRPFVHIDDISRALVLALEAPTERVAGQIFNIGANEHNHQLCELGTIISEMIPGTEVATLDQVVDRRNYYVDFGRARRVLEFTPSRTLRDGVREIQHAVASRLVGHFRESQYHNHLHLKAQPADAWPAWEVGTVIPQFAAI